MGETKRTGTLADFLNGYQILDCHQLLYDESSKPQTIVTNDGEVVITLEAGLLRMVQDRLNPRNAGRMVISPRFVSPNKDIAFHLDSFNIGSDGKSGMKIFSSEEIDSLLSSKGEPFRLQPVEL